MNMKKIILSIVLIFITTGIFAQLANPDKIKEGLIVYNVDWEVPEQMQALKANLPKELKVYFKGDSSCLKTESAMYKSTNILNLNKEYERLLLDIPMLGKKLSVIFSPADRDKIRANMPDLSIRAGSETKTIAGYKALKHNVTEKKSNQTSEAWFTKDAEITPNSLSRFFDKNLGLPLEFTSYMNGLSLKAVVKEIQRVPVPAGSFTATKDFEEITLDDLMQMQGER